MRFHSGKIFLAGTVLWVTFACLGLAESHQKLNGTWTLMPTRSDFGGEPAIQTGTVTINDREHNIYISRNFNYDSPKQTASYSFSTDGRESSSIRQGKTFKTKAKWDDKVLRVITTGDDVTETELYSLAPDGTLMLVLERPGHAPLTLYFQRQ